MSKQITIRDSQSISRDMLTTDENGNAVQIAMVSGDIRPGRGLQRGKSCPGIYRPPRTWYTESVETGRGGLPLSPARP